MEGVVRVQGETGSHDLLSVQARRVDRRWAANSYLVTLPAFLGFLEDKDGSRDSNLRSFGKEEGVQGGRGRGVAGDGIVKGDGG